MSSRKILLIEDDAEIVELLEGALRKEGFEVCAAGSGEAGLAMLESSGFDLVLLDVMLPGIHGFETMRRIRSGWQVPVIMLTARGEEVDRIVGLEIGADDYLAKPFSFRELAARIQAVLRRAQGVRGDGTQKQRGIHLDGGTRTVWRDGRIVDLTAAEFELLRILMRSAGEAVGRELLCRKVLDRDYSAMDRGIDNLISSLRKKLGPTSEGLERIKTLRNLGYAFAATDYTCAD